MNCPICSEHNSNSDTDSSNGDCCSKLAFRKTNIQISKKRSAGLCDWEKTHHSKTIECPLCSNKGAYMLMKIRSAERPTVTFYRCSNSFCNYNWNHQEANVITKKPEKKEISKKQFKNALKFSMFETQKVSNK